MSAVLTDVFDEILQVLPEHIPAVLEIELAAYQFPWTEGLLRDCLKSNYHFYAMFRQEEIIAYGIMSCVVNEAHLLNLCVRPDCQRQGIGGQMLNHLQDIAHQEKSHTIFLEVRQSNLDAKYLYENNGFNRLGDRKGYYPGETGREDATIYAKELVAD